MKKIIIAAAVIIAIVAGICFINTYEKDTDVTDTPTKVGVILDGFKNDKSRSQSHYEALEKTGERLNLDITYKEYVIPDMVMPVIQELIENGCVMIIANSALYHEYISAAAELYPEIYFFHAAGSEQRKNLCTYF